MGGEETRCYKMEILMMEPESETAVVRRRARKPKVKTGYVFLFFEIFGAKFYEAQYSTSCAALQISQC